MAGVLKHTCVHYAGIPNPGPGLRDLRFVHKLQMTTLKYSMDGKHDVTLVNYNTVTSYRTSTYWWTDLYPLSHKNLLQPLQSSCLYSMCMKCSICRWNVFIRKNKTYNCKNYLHFYYHSGRPLGLSQCDHPNSKSVRGHKYYPGKTQKITLYTNNFLQFYSKI